MPALFTRIWTGPDWNICWKTVFTWARSEGRACNASDQAQVKTVFQQIFQSGPVQILVNSAGIAHIGNLESTSADDFDRVYRVNVMGTYNCMQACIGHLKANGAGVILNMASVSG